MNSSAIVVHLPVTPAENPEHSSSAHISTAVMQTLVVVEAKTYCELVVLNLIAVTPARHEDSMRPRPRANRDGEPPPNTAKHTSRSSYLAQPRNAQLRQDAGHRVHSREKRLVATGLTLAFRETGCQRAAYTVCLMRRHSTTLRPAS